jgi:ABC-type transporter Mla MlaB component
MELQLCVAVETNPEGTQVRLVVTGHLTESNHRALFLLAKRARGLSSHAEVVVDLTGAASVEASAVDLLMWELDHHHASAAEHPVGIVVPEPLPPSSGSGTVPGRQTLWTRTGRRGTGYER